MTSKKQIRATQDAKYAIGHVPDSRVAVVGTFKLKKIIAGYLCNYLMGCRWVTALKQKYIKPPIKLYFPNLTDLVLSWQLATSQIIDDKKQETRLIIISFGNYCRPRLTVWRNRFK